MLNSDSVDKKYQANSTSKYPNSPEQTMWLRRTKNGDGTAFSYIAEKYQQPVYNLCYRMLGNADDAEDAAQEVFIRAYAKLDTYDDTSKFSTWLFSIASHFCIDRFRKRRFNLISWDDLGSWYHFPDQGTPQPEQALIKAEAAQEIQNLLSLLPPDYRLALILKYWYAMSCQEIAQTLETTVSAVKSKLFRARKMISTQIATAQVAPSSRMAFNSPLKIAQPECIQ
jgi:RNA polymerase sigma-70 factor (ECF subfamily)